METTRLSSKGQIVIPGEVRKAHGWQPGDEFLVRDLGNGLLLVPLKAFPRTELADVVGCVGYSGPARSLEEMEQAIARGALEQQD